MEEILLLSAAKIIVGSLVVFILLLEGYIISTASRRHFWIDWSCASAIALPIFTLSLICGDVAAEFSLSQRRGQRLMPLNLRRSS